jgi:hypothetical protein
MVFLAKFQTRLKFDLFLAKFKKFSMDNFNFGEISFSNVDVVFMAARFGL